MPAFDKILEIARSNGRRIVLPEAHDERIMRAAIEVFEQGIAEPVLLGNSANLKTLAAGWQLSLTGIELIDPAQDSARDRYAELLTEIRAQRGMTLEQAKIALLDHLYFACLMVKSGTADGCVCGAVTPTADVVRTAMRVIGKRPEVTKVSSFFIMLLRAWHPVQDVVVVADCALVINPDSAELAAIGAATGDSANALLGLDPQVAMLSFSTAGSARHSTVKKVSEATRLLRDLRPDWRIVGEVQLDAAVIPDILARKSPDQAHPQPCNVLIFPNLDAGNIGYKLIERFGGAQAIGPVMQGLAKPVNDLSRGCSKEDVVSIIAVTAAQCS